MIEAINADDKDRTRRIVSPKNCRVSNGGSLSDVDLSTGRARRTGSIPEIRAQAGVHHRVVSVTPRVEVGDLLWIRRGTFESRKKSRGVLVVLAVDVARVQDMTETEALREGIDHVPRKRGHPDNPRDRFALLWDSINGAGAWRRNDWTWIYVFKHHAVNVETLCEERGIELGKKK
jgi:hypothetical protein